MLYQPNGGGCQMESSMFLKETTHTLPQVLVCFPNSIDEKRIINRVGVRSDVSHIRGKISDALAMRKIVRGWVATYALVAGQAFMNWASYVSQVLKSLHGRCPNCCSSVCWSRVRRLMAPTRLCGFAT